MSHTPKRFLSTLLSITPFRARIILYPGSGGVAFGLQRGVVDDQAADKAQEEGQQEANQLVVIHEYILLSRLVLSL